MENNPDMESFEDFIKQQSDDFRMYPSKRVWYSLYNNLHPGRKWPSISMCIVLLTALFLIGFLNGGNNYNKTRLADNGQGKSNSGNATIATTDKIVSINNNTIVAPEAVTNVAQLQAAPKTSVSQKHKPGAGSALNISRRAIEQPVNTATEIKAVNTVVSTDEPGKAAEKFSMSSQATADAKSLPALPIGNTIESEIISPSPDIITGQPAGETDSQEKAVDGKSQQIQELKAAPVNVPTAPPGDSPNPAATLEVNGKVDASAADSHSTTGSTSLNITDKSWVENYALYNRPAPKKWKGKLAWQAYLTPSVSYRKLFNNAVGKNIGNPAAGIAGSTDATLSSEVTHSASVGMEGGIALQYPLLKGIKIKAGLQLNYTRYNISAFENSHPTGTSLEMISEFNGQPYELYKATAYSNNAGLKPVTLHSQTFQFSIPVGADLKLAGNDLFEWYAGAALQPTLVLGASSFLVSTDRRNYVKDNSMLNHFNVNAAFETYISFKSAGGLTWQIGPQFRKQLYSTSTRLYTVEERLMGYGLKIGFVKKF